MKRAVIATVSALLAAAALAAATQCLGVTKKGASCRNMTNNANGYCHLHQSQASK